MTNQTYDDFFRQVFASLKRKFPRMNYEELLKAARRVIEDLQSQRETEGVFDETEFTTIRRLRSPSMIGRDIELGCQIASMSTPKAVPLPDDTGRPIWTLAAHLTVSDGAGDTIDTLEVLGEVPVHQLEDLARRGTMFQLTGKVLVLPPYPDGSGGDFVLSVLKVSATAGALEILGATTAERQWAEVQLSEIQARGESLIDHILERIFRELHIVNVAPDTPLHDALRFTVLQSISCGGLGGKAGGALHLLLIGPPARGKKLVGLAARILNPRAREASAAKISPAGLIGATFPTKEGWKSEPGLLSQADHGVFVLQDAHTASERDVRRIGAIFQQLIEDGAVSDGKAGGVHRSMTTRLVIDANRTSHLQAGGRRNGREAPILTLRPLLSRMDLIVEIPEDPDAAWETASRMYESMVTSASASPEEQPWVREVRLLVATLRDRHADIDLSAVRALMRFEHDRIAAENKDLREVMPEAGDLAGRLPNSFGRLVAASARANDRAIADATDVAEALRYLRRKLYFYRMLAPDVATDSSRRDERRNFYRRYSGKVVRPDDLARYYQESTGDSVSDRQVNRDLRQMGAKRVSKGMYLLPPPGGDHMTN